MAATDLPGPPLTRRKGSTLMACSSTLHCAVGAFLAASLLLLSWRAGEVAWSRIAGSQDDPVFQKALAAFLLFQKAADAEQVTLGLLQEMATSLERTRRAMERR